MTAGEQGARAPLSESLRALARPERTGYIYADEVAVLRAAADELDALEAERDDLRKAFETEVRVCSARTTMLDDTKALLARKDEALRAGVEEARTLLRPSANWSDNAIRLGLRQLADILDAALAAGSDPEEDTIDG